MDAAVEEGRSSGRTPERVLLEDGALSSDQYARAVAERFGLDHVDLTVYKADLSALNLIGPQAAKRFNAVPIGFDDAGALMVAMVDPSNVLALDDLKLMTGQEVRPVVASYEDVTTPDRPDEPPERRGGRGDRGGGRGARRPSATSASRPTTRRS